MKILAIVSQKGGAGKTTLALNLAAAAFARGYKTVVLDTDPQVSATEWSDRRDSDPRVIAVPAKRLSAVVEGARSSGAQLIIIDTPPSASAEAMEAVRVADFVIVPSRPSILDMNAIGATLELVTKIAPRPYSVVLTQCSPVGLEADQAAEFFRAKGFKVSDARIHARKVYSTSLIEGRTAAEVDPLGKAWDEIDVLFKTVLKQLGLTRKAA